MQSVTDFISSWMQYIVWRCDLSAMLRLKEPPSCKDDCALPSK